MLLNVVEKLAHSSSLLHVWFAVQQLNVMFARGRTYYLLLRRLPARDFIIHSRFHYTLAALTITAFLPTVKLFGRCELRRQPLVNHSFWRALFTPLSRHDDDVLKVRV